MKRIIVVASLIAFVSISCQKEENINPVALQQEKGAINNKIGDKPIKMRKLYWVPGHDGATPDCHDEIPGNCFPDVDVQPSIASVIDDVFDVVTIGSQSDVQAAFGSNYSELNSVIPADIMVDVMNGDLIVTSTVYNAKNVRFLLFHADGVIDLNNPQAAIPFK